MERAPDSVTAYQYIAQNCSNPMIFLNSAKTIIYANTSWFEFSGTPMSSSSSSCSLSIPATAPWNWLNEQSAFLRIVDLALTRSPQLSADGYVFELRSGSGSAIPVTAKFIAFEEICVCMFYGLFLRFGLTDWTTMLTQSSLAMGLIELLLVEHDSIIRYVNSAALAFLTKASIDEVLNKRSVGELHWPQNDFDRFWMPMFMATLQSKKTIRTLPKASTSSITSENKHIKAAVCYVGHHIHSNNPMIAFVIEDFTAGVRTEEENQRAKRLSEAKDLFMASVSHELRTPLSSILGLARLMADMPELNAEMRDYVETLLLCSTSVTTIKQVLGDKRYNNIIKLDLLEFSQIENNTFRLSIESFHVLDVVEQAIEIVSLAANRKPAVALAFDFQLPVDILPCQLLLSTDMSRVRQVLVNLLMNAIKFTHVGHVYLQITLSDTSIHFSVKDTGVGIAPQNMQKLFQPFSQAEESVRKKYGGTGLGLSLCKMLVERMGGSIGFESEEGKGSTFYFRLPLPSPSSSSATGTTSTTGTTVGTAKLSNSSRTSGCGNVGPTIVAPVKSEISSSVSAKIPPPSSFSSRSRSNSLGNVIVGPASVSYLNKRRRSLQFDHKTAVVLTQGSISEIETTSLVRKLKIFLLAVVICDTVDQLVSLPIKPDVVMAHTPAVEWTVRNRLPDVPVILMARDRPLVSSRSSSPTSERPESSLSSSNAASAPMNMISSPRGAPLFGTATAAALATPVSLHQSSKSLPKGYDYPHYFVRKPVKLTQLEAVLQVALSGLSHSSSSNNVSQQPSSIQSVTPMQFVNNSSLVTQASASVPSSSLLARRSLHSSGLSSRFARSHPMSILVAEDNEANLKVLMKMLQRLGYDQVANANNGQAALERYSECHFDVIFMDINMPVMDGIEATTTLRRRESASRERPYIICITADVYPEDRSRAVHAGMNAFLAKPFDVGSLTSVLSQAWEILYPESDTSSNASPSASSSSSAASSSSCSSFSSWSTPNNAV